MAKKTVIKHNYPFKGGVPSIRCPVSEQSNYVHNKNRFSLTIFLVEAKKANEELQLKYDNLRNENEEMLNQRKQDRERLTSLQERYDKLHTDLDSMTSKGIDIV